MSFYTYLPIGGNWIVAVDDSLSVGSIHKSENFLQVGVLCFAFCVLPSWGFIFLGGNPEIELFADLMFGGQIS